MWCYFVFYTETLKLICNELMRILIYLKRRNGCVSASPVSPCYSKMNKYHFIFRCDGILRLIRIESGTVYSPQFYHCIVLGSLLVCFVTHKGQPTLDWFAKMPETLDKFHLPTDSLRLLDATLSFSDASFIMTEGS